MPSNAKIKIPIELPMSAHLIAEMYSLVRKVVSTCEVLAVIITTKLKTMRVFATMLQSFKLAISLMKIEGAQSNTDTTSEGMRLPQKNDS